MTPSLSLPRRRLLAGLAALPALGLPLWARGEGLPPVTVTRDPSCGCCGAWAAHLEAAGFAVRIVETDDAEAAKRRLGVPEDLWSCHTAEVAGYAVEGHVPAEAILRLLAERPEAAGLAVPGMPPGAPGMEAPGQEEPYEVVLFGPGIGPAGTRAFMRFEGLRAL